jgi:hypothetical protein
MNTTPPKTNSAPSQMTSILASTSLYSPNPLAPAPYHQFSKAGQSRQQPSRGSPEASCECGRNCSLALRGRVAWAHDWISDPSLVPVFEALPGASFIVNGATPAKNSALTSAGAELRLINGVSVLAKFDGEFATHSQTYAGTGTVRYVW